jgi:hypothetical protein
MRQYRVMGKTAEKWRKQVEPHFGFLSDHGFTVVDVDDSSFWSLWVQYRSGTAAVRISKSNETGRAEVQLIRLVDGEVPPYPIWITENRIDWTLLDNVVEVRQPYRLGDVGRLSGLTASKLDQQLHFGASVLRDVAPEFQDGDCAPIDEAGELIRSRVAEHPQQVQVWIPKEAAVGSETDQIAEVQSTVPPNVGVSVRRYWRGRGSRSK